MFTEFSLLIYPYIHKYIHTYDSELKMMLERAGWKVVFSKVRVRRLKYLLKELQQGRKFWKFKVRTNWNHLWIWSDQGQKLHVAFSKLVDCPLLTTKSLVQTEWGWSFFPLNISCWWNHVFRNPNIAESFDLFVFPFWWYPILFGEYPILFDFPFTSPPLSFPWVFPNVVGAKSASIPMFNPWVFKILYPKDSSFLDHIH